MLHFETIYAAENRYETWRMDCKESVLARFTENRRKRICKEYVRFSGSKI